MAHCKDKKKKRGTKDGKSSKDSPPKVPKDVVGAARPVNADEEKARFLEACKSQRPVSVASPQFTYTIDRPLLDMAMLKYPPPSHQYLPHALRIMEQLKLVHGTYEAFKERNGGPRMSDEDANQVVQAYLADHALVDVIRVNFTTGMVAFASMTNALTNPTINLRSGEQRSRWIEGVLNHELGTHFIRSMNNSGQVWAKKRKKYGLEDKNPTEEGLAALHTVLERDGHHLWRAALLYYATWKATQVSFSELFDDLGQFLDSEEDRWDYCLRAKRGLSDSSAPGGLSKDQMYLTGAMQILEERKTVDPCWLYCGKVSLADGKRLCQEQTARVADLKYPRFLLDVDRYRRLLDEIVVSNNLVDLVDGPEAAALATSDKKDASDKKDM
mmetsp:Transcript_60960/g.163506  ORF Transcript_60960/g.163506 Transcript_60960/m.163506 type:complete len:385 (-) Transcript_60960:68-1222(-)